MVKRTSFEKAECPIARSLDVIGDWWSLLIIRDALLGKRRFNEFQKSLGLAKNILTVRLRAMVEHGILKTAPASDGSAYQEYLPTPKCRGVFPVLVALRQWSEEFDDRPEEIATLLVDREKRPAGAQARTARPGWAAARRRRHRLEASPWRQACTALARLNNFAPPRLRQLSLAAKPQPLLRLQLRHAKQEAEQAEPVATRQPGEVGDHLRNKGRGLVRTAIPVRLVGSRTPIPARGCARPPAPNLAQKITSNRCII